MSKKKGLAGIAIDDLAEGASAKPKPADEASPAAESAERRDRGAATSAAPKPSSSPPEPKAAPRRRRRPPADDAPATVGVTLLLPKHVHMALKLVAQSRGTNLRGLLTEEAIARAAEWAAEAQGAIADVQRDLRAAGRQPKDGT